MRTSLQRVDEILARVPADSRIGREVHSEITAHLEEATANHVADGKGYDVALDVTLDDFGASEELERVYYRDYVAQRYWLGWVDREAWRDGRWVRELGVALVLLGILLYQVLPTVAGSVAALSVAVSQLGGASADGDSLRSLVEAAPELALPLALDPKVGGVRVWGLLAGVGVLLLALAGARSLRRLRLPVSAADVALVAAVAVAGFLSILTTTDPGLYTDAFAASLFVTPLEASPTGLQTQGYFALVGGLVLVALALWVFVRAIRAGVADTYLLRRGAIYILAMVAALYLMAHPQLRAGLDRMAIDRSAFSPVQLFRLLRGDLTWFVGGAVIFVWAVLGISRTFAEADRIFAARRSADEPLSER